MKIKGIIEDIIYMNEDNSYTVAVLSNDDGYITIVGNAFGMKVSDEVELEGEYVFHDLYGEQFKFKYIMLVEPSSKENILKFLSSRNISAVGPATAKKIVDFYGEETLDIMNYNPDKLLKINGIGKAKLKKIISSYGEVVESRDNIMFLQSVGVGSNLISKILKFYGKNTKSIILKNPYILYDDIDGIGFKKADLIAEKLGVEKDSKYRIRSYIKHYLYESSNNGNAFLYRDKLELEVKEKLEIDEKLVSDEIDELIIKGDLFKEKLDGERIYLSYIYFAESSVAAKLMAINSFENKGDFNKKKIETLLINFQTNNNIILNEDQKNAVRSAINKKITVITGGPGTGKTTIVDAILYISNNFNLKVHLTAPTGRAAKRMEETTKHSAKTIHRLLEYQYIEDKRTLTFNKNEQDTLSGDIIIVDEFSMIDINLLKSLLDAVTLEFKLVFIGDIDQLPSIGPGNVLKDIISSNMFSTIWLNEIYRQSENSYIVLNAHRINNGKMPISNNQEGDFFFMPMKDQNEIIDNLLNLVTKRLPDYYKFDPLTDIQIIAPIKNGLLGTKKINEIIQNTLNPYREDKEEIIYQSKKFRDGDKVMQFKNNYNINWIDINTLLKGQGVFNGEIGYITNIDLIDKTIKVLFDRVKEVIFEYKDLEDIELSYAITIHKAQGSEFNCIVMPISFIPPKMESKNLLYTAVTRGKKLVIIVGDKKYIYRMVNSSIILERNSGLIEKLRRFQKI